MAQFDILVDKKDVNRNDPFNNKTAYRIRTNEEANLVNERLQSKYLSSISQMSNVAEADDKINQIIYDKKKITLPGVVHDFIQETDEKYYNPYTFKKNVELYNNNLRVYNEQNKAPKAEGFSGNFFTGHLTDDSRRVFGSDHLRERIEWKQGVINKIIEEDPDAFADVDLSLLDYQVYENKNKEELAYLEKEQNIISEYNEGDILGFIEPGSWGTFKGVVKDPALWSTLPLSLSVGGNTMAVAGILKMALWEGAIAAATETGIQFNVVDYSKHLDGQYGWNEARTTIAFAGAGGAVGAAAFAGIFKGIRSVYVNTLARSQNKKIQDIASKVNSIIENKGETEESLSEILDTLDLELDKLSNAEKKQVLDLLPDDFKKPFTKTTQRVLDGDEIVDNSNPLENTIPGVKEHSERIEQAGEELLSNNTTTLNDETISKVNLDKNYDEGKVIRDQRLDPDEITVDAETFQFKKVDYDPKTGVSTKLKDVKVWDQDSAETVLVFQKQDGTYVIADGHQRLALAKRIKSEGKQKPYLLANIYREADGYTENQIMVRAMIKNVRTGTASSTDVAKILRQPENFIQNLTESISPTSKLWKNAVELSKLSDNAFGYFLNNGIDDDIAALVGNLVTDPNLQIQVMDFLVKGGFKPGRQMEFAVRDLLSQGVGERQVEDLFGTQTIKELLFNERAAVLDTALRDINKDKRLAKYLVSNEGAIISKGKNKLDTKTNKKIGKESELIYEYVKKNAYRKGEISDELTKAAKLYKAGNKQEAVRAFKEFISRRIEQGDITRDSRVGTERNPFLEGYSQDKAQKPKVTEEVSNFEDYKDPIDGKKEYTREYGQVEDVLDQIRAKLIPEKEIKKVDLTGKTLSELAELDDDVLKNQADELLDHPEIQKLRDKVEQIPRTIDRAGGKFNESWKKSRNWESVVNDLYGDGATVKEKKLIIYAGLPASGKSTRALADKDAIGAMIIDSDYVKEHPNFADDYMGGIGANALHDESKAIQTLIMQRAFTNGDNFILPVVGSSGKSMIKFIDQAKDFGYSVYVKYVEVDETTAIARNIKRINNDGRFVDPKYIKLAYKNINENYKNGKELADGYEKINLEGNRPVTEESGGAIQEIRKGGSEDVPGLDEVAARAEETFLNVDPEYKLFTKVNEDGTLEEQTVADALKEIFEDKKAIDFLKNCKGLK